MTSYLLPMEWGTIDHTNKPGGVSLDERFAHIYNNTDGLQHDLHELDRLAGNNTHVHKRHRLHWGVYEGREVVIKTPKGNTSLQIEQNTPPLTKEINILKSLMNDNILRVLAYDKTTLVTERFGYSATTIGSYQDMATVAAGCILALKHMHTHKPCYRHGNVHAKNIFLEKKNQMGAMTISNVVLGGFTNATECENTGFTGNVGYTGNETTNKRHDIVSLAITLINAYFNTLLKDRGVYITYANHDEIVSLMDSRVQAILRLMIQANSVPLDEWESFMDTLLSEWNEITTGKIHPLGPPILSPETIVKYGHRVVDMVGNRAQGLKRKRRSSSRRDDGIRNFNTFMNRDNGPKAPTNRINTAYNEIINVGFNYFKEPTYDVEEFEVEGKLIRFDEPDNNQYSGPFDVDELFAETVKSTPDIGAGMGSSRGEGGDEEDFDPRTFDGIWR